MRGNEDASLLELFSSPAQREVIDRITAVMSLLEGHADVVMDGVGPGVIPSVDVIRTKFNQRRKGVVVVDEKLALRSAPRRKGLRSLRAFAHRSTPTSVSSSRSAQ